MKMISQVCSWYVLVPFLFTLMRSGSSLVCHKCTGKFDKNCERVECPSSQTKCATVISDVIKNGTVLTSTYRRQCVAGQTFCDRHAESVGPAFARSSPDSSMKMVQRKCELCEADLCNAVNEEENRFIPKKISLTSIICYDCLSDNPDDGCRTGDSSLPTVECDFIEKRCATEMYNVAEGANITNVVYKRGCATENNFCAYSAKFIRELYVQKVQDGTEMYQTYCEVCDEDNCNGGNPLFTRKEEVLYSKNFYNSSGSSVSSLLLVFLTISLVININ